MKQHKVDSKWAKAQSRGETNKEIAARLQREWFIIKEPLQGYISQPDVTIGDLVINILGFTEMHYDKAVLVGAMVDAAIFEHWEQEEAIHAAVVEHWEQEEAKS